MSYNDGAISTCGQVTKFPTLYSLQYWWFLGVCEVTKVQLLHCNNDDEITGGQITTGPIGHTHYSTEGHIQYMLW